MESAALALAVDAVVLPDYKGQEVSVYAVYPERKYLSPKVRAFIDFLAERFSPEPYWDDF